MPRQISNGLALVPRSPQLLIEGPRCTDCEALWDGCAIFTNKHKLYLSCFQFAVQLTSCGDLDPNNSTQKWHFIINLLEHRRGRNCHQGCFFFLILRLLQFLYFTYTLLLTSSGNTSTPTSATLLTPVPTSELKMIYIGPEGLTNRVGLGGEAVLAGISSRWLSVRRCLSPSLSPRQSRAWPSNHLFILDVFS